MTLAAAWLGACIFLAWTIEAMSGFGSIVIALSLGALLLPIESMLPVLVTLNVITSSWLAWQHRRHIDRALLLKRILPWMLTGTLAGVLLRDVLPAFALKTGFSLLLLWFAGKELLAIYRGRKLRPHSPVMTQALLSGAGITHGLFASGGPLLVYALAGGGVDKARFRATLISVWLLLNGVLLGFFLVQGKITAHVGEIAMYLPVVLASVLLGNRLHHGLKEEKFRHMVFCLLAVVGAALLLSQLRAYLA
ncbi:MAG: sulfite exporter TauE/SafE family protein [Moraxellaceae bacterium]